MNSITQIIAGEFEALKAETIAAYKSSGMAASGNWADTVQLIELPNGFSLVADSYITGRKPGRQPPSEAIEKWLADKGIAARLEKDISISSLAYLIARKIGREGWQPKQDFLADIITPARIQQIINKAGDAALADCTTQILDYFKPAIA